MSNKIYIVEDSSSRVGCNGGVFNVWLRGRLIAVLPTMQDAREYVSSERVVLGLVT